MKIAVYTIALNEAAHAERWANSAADADYRIVADTGSTDDTVERLTRAGVTVHRIAVRPWRFDVARNAAMALIPDDVDVCCTMDMDRWLKPGWRAKLEAAWTPGTTALFGRIEYRASVDDPAVLRGWPAKNFHHRWGYRFRRPVHEALSYTGEEVTSDGAVMCEVQDHGKTTRSQYLPLMELAHQEDPDDGQICFWLGRDYMWAERHAEAIPLLRHYLSRPTSTWTEERSEAMRYLARMQPNQKMSWLDKARTEAPHRRETWLDLAEELHGQADWLNLFWACTNGIEKTHRTGSYLDDPHCWGFRLHDLGALAAWHLNVMDRAVEWGEKALELDPTNQRLKNNLDFFIRRRDEVRLAAVESTALNVVTEPLIEQTEMADRQAVSAKVAIVSAADTSFFDLLRGLIQSIKDKQHGETISIYVFDLGLTDDERQWLYVRGVEVRTPSCQYNHIDLPKVIQALLARCRLPEHFPGHDVYLWIDADAWIQRWVAIDAYVTGALTHGFAIAQEVDEAYDMATIQSAHAWSLANFGEQATHGFASTPPINAGVFAGSAAAPHWKEWQKTIDENISRVTTYPELFLFDQTALFISLTHSGLSSTFLPSIYNWICHSKLPAITPDAKTLLHPTEPYTPLGILHMTGATKRYMFSISRPDGVTISRSLAYMSSSLLPAGDYVSPNFSIVISDKYFPNMIKGGPESSTWPYLRRSIGHNWYVDTRFPTWGFLSRDEVHLLYNIGLRFAGKRVLEIGCLTGWSTFHLAIAGARLDVIDPLLGNSDVCKSVAECLESAGTLARVTLVPGTSPDAVARLARERGCGWSLFFIDGNHDSPAPLMDAMECEKYAETDAAMLFHDVSSPDVWEPLQYLMSTGWSVRIYHTAQLMALAWRGDIQPIDHDPDPKVNWTIPAHLRDFFERDNNNNVSKEKACSL